MATKKQSYKPIPSGGLQFEFDESEVWESTSNTTSNTYDVVLTSEARRSTAAPNPRHAKKAWKKGGRSSGGHVASSLPLNIPDWKRILGKEYHEDRLRRRQETGGDGDNVTAAAAEVEEEDGYWVPPHEYLARTRAASLSVHEGVGRTLKGRDLRRVRNAIWKQTGFED